MSCSCTTKYIATDAPIAATATAAAARRETRSLKLTALS
jgi:hypothetical protein